MRRSRPLLLPLVFALTVVAFAPGVRADGSGLVISHVGMLLDGTDTPVDDPGLSLEFRFFTASAHIDGEAALWDSGACTVRVSKGRYSVLLGGAGLDTGCGSPIAPSALPASGAEYLEISIGGTALSPRLRLGTVPTAASASHADDSDKLGGLSLDDLDARYARVNDGGAAQFTGDVQTSGKFVGDGSGLTALSAGALTGTMPDAVLPADVMTLGADQTVTGKKTFGQTVTASAFAGDGSQLTGLKAESVSGTFASVTSAGPVKAPAFAGDGSQLTAVNAATVQNGVYTSGSYADPAWLTSLSASKISGTVSSASGFTGSLAGDVTGAQGATKVTALQGAPLAATTPTSQQVLTFNGSTWTPSPRNLTVALTDATNISVDASKGNVFDVTLRGNHTMGAPTNLVDGETYTFRVHQDATGGRKLTWDGAFVFSGDDLVSPSSNDLSIFRFVSDGSSLFAVGAYNAQPPVPVVACSGTGVTQVNSTTPGQSRCTFSYVGAQQTLQVTGGSGNLNFHVWGAAGGGFGGGGAAGEGALPVATGDQFKIYVGGAGVYSNWSSYAGSGGGATYVLKNTAPVMIAGGGGGGGYSSGGAYCQQGVAGTASNDGTVDSYCYQNGCVYGRGGTGGNGGGSFSQTVGCSWGGGGGGGLNGAGATDTCQGVSGGQPGPGGAGGTYSGGGTGGYGGGGGAYVGGGGGGGYSGGGGGSNSSYGPYCGGGGGGSYTTFGTMYSGSGSNPGNSGSAYYQPGIAKGCQGNCTGGNGQVVVTW